MKIEDAGRPAHIAWDDVFVGAVANSNTRIAYERAVRYFLLWADEHVPDKSLPELTTGGGGRLDVDHYSYEGDQWILSFREKRNKVRKIPVSHDLQGWIDEYLARASVLDAPPWTDPKTGTKCRPPLPYRGAQGETAHQYPDDKQGHLPDDEVENERGRLFIAILPSPGGLLKLSTGP